MTTDYEHCGAPEHCTYCAAILSETSERACSPHDRGRRERGASAEREASCARASPTGDPYEAPRPLTPLAVKSSVGGNYLELTANLDPRHQATTNVHADGYAIALILHDAREGGETPRKDTLDANGIPIPTAAGIRKLQEEGVAMGDEPRTSRR